MENCWEHTKKHKFELSIDFVGLYTFFECPYNISIFYVKGAVICAWDTMSDKEMMKVMIEEFSGLQTLCFLYDSMN